MTDRVCINCEHYSLMNAFCKDKQEPKKHKESCAKFKPFNDKPPRAKSGCSGNCKEAESSCPGDCASDGNCGDDCTCGDKVDGYYHLWSDYDND